MRCRRPAVHGRNANRHAGYATIDQGDLDGFAFDENETVAGQVEELRPPLTEPDPKAGTNEAESAAVRIQATVRGRNARKDIEAQHAAATQLQSVARGRAARKGAEDPQKASEHHHHQRQAAVGS